MDKLVSALQYFLLGSAAIATIYWTINQQKQLDLWADIGYRVLGDVVCLFAAFATLRLQKMADHFERKVEEYARLLAVAGFTEVGRDTATPPANLFNRSSRAFLFASMMLYLAVAIAWWMKRLV